ncbi:putative nuclease HARBI1 [Dermacentor andersoni]|uniref:putative nuclease HARBI1 n=1 Tax=Dermacentor andersoni TaxID=34620 RepID=UPI00241772BF|nr:putative nuclease HARBI1 [Dermacentor andersoni]
MAAVRLARLQLIAELLMRRERVFRDRTNIFEVFDEDELQRRFRFGRAGIAYLAELLRDDLQHPTRRSHALSVEQQVVLALKFFATGGFLITAGDTINVHESTASRTVRRVALALVRHCSTWIRWPSPNELAEVQTNFYGLGGFPCVVGAIDGTHVRIQAPEENEEAYVNRHFYHSINVQLVVDANCRILDVVAKWPGGTHDARMLANSSLAKRFDRGVHTGLLLGDSGYPCRPWLMTPFRTPDTPGKRRYNAAHGTTRAVVERKYVSWLPPAEPTKLLFPLQGCCLQLNVLPIKLDHLLLPCCCC